MISPANRISNVKEYYFSKKLREIARMRNEGIDILNLGIGNPDLPPSVEVIQKLHEYSAPDSDHGYQSYAGIPELREAFSEWYSKWFHTELNADSEILPLIGSKEGITHISLAFLNTDDEVLVPDPGYPTYTSVSELVGAKVRKYDLKEENGWYPDFQLLEQEGVEKVKLMWINYPNMPTGTPATKAFFETAVAFAKKHNILLVNDNPYSFILNDNPFSIMGVPGAKEVCIELNSLSKSHNMAGWRIGVAVSNETYIKYLLRVKSNVDSGMFRGLQVAASKALEAPLSWYENNNRVYAQRRNLALKIMDKLGCSYDEKQTGMFIWAKIPEHEECVEDFSDSILMKAHVFITPGFIFGENGKRFIRISLCSPEIMLKDALNRIKEKM